VTPREKRLQRNAVKAGIKAAKRKHHLLSESELRELKVQVLSNPLRIILGILSLLCAAAAAIGWPSEENSVQALLACASLLLLVFSIFGVRRTLADALDQMAAEGSIELLSHVLGAIAEAVGDAVDL
jgi:peptidoglycan/LPS O-acetylase OafA/YrhL